jgi:hypothetical protein
MIIFGTVDMKLFAAKGNARKIKLNRNNTNPKFNNGFCSS